ncbi:MULTISPECIES: class I SAM-dependent methyltransferase [Prauserella salsuginis group]|uniref:Class I SAM-dependent methyltransferase n=1 Tax=Prauserella salsuginis TaxID=387889 RepID=A0ABW6G206_9PSEU|nr:MULTISPECIES: class I SAM-dependent methyltransferase [Prauserella salsuginis group]MCR3720007.1 O-Methyltransferase involved in polyketide biosynthesis [Prauserella flava]MCR3736449.1 O-Methyltransferase involved in polyketide biosynthesis [Prauserella salsuginis]
MTLVSIDHLTPMQKTLLITLKGRAVDSQGANPLLGDALATDVLGRLDYDTGSVKLMAGVPEAVAIRSAMLDRAVAGFVRTHPDAVVVELGSGLETRRFRVDPPQTVDWYDVDFPEVIELRERLLPDRDDAHGVGVSLLDTRWTDGIPRDRPTIVVADGVVGFLTEEQNRRLLPHITDHFASGELIFNAYSTLAARMAGRYLRTVGMPPDYRTFGIGDPQDVVALAPELTFVEEQWGDAAPERERLPLAYRLMARTFARWPAQARRGAWIVRYRF